VASGRQGGEPAALEALMPCWEAIRLARAVAAHPATADAEADALSALLLLHGARLTGRVDAHGDIVPLRGQPRDRWDGGLLRLGFAHLGASQRGERLSRWHLQAGIAAEHARATDPADTDWPAIVRYYDLLLALDPSPAPRLGHAIALAEAGAPDEARARLQALLPAVPASLRAHTWAALARAHERLGDAGPAAECLAQAIAHAPHPADARRLRAQGNTKASAAGTAPVQPVTPAPASTPTRTPETPAPRQSPRASPADPTSV
jgi:RNA polymerase sigma-70 factor (ECF subfamily)